MESIGTRIAKLRKEKNITQKALAQEIGISDKAVSKWEQGGSPDIDLLPSLAKFFNVSVDFLMGINQPKQSKNSAIENELENLEKEAAEQYKDTVLKATLDGLICVDILLNETKNYLLIEKVLKNNPIHYFELIDKLLVEEKFRDLYLLAVEHNWVEIINDMASQKYEKVLDTAFNHIVVGYSYDATISENKPYFYKKEGAALEYKEKNFGHSRNLVDKISKLKDIIMQIKAEIILQITTDLKNKGLLKSLTKEHFYSLLSSPNKRDRDILIIDLCRRLEVVLKWTFHYEGELAEMLTKYCSSECDTEMAELLQRLRKVRNSLVHSEMTSDTISDDELVKCIEHICDIN